MSADYTADTHISWKVGWQNTDFYRISTCQENTLYFMGKGYSVSLQQYKSPEPLWWYLIYMAVTGKCSIVNYTQY